MKIQGIRVLITGGGRGIGRHLVERFRDEQAHVGVLEFDQAAVSELTELGASAWQCDVADADAVDAALKKVCDSGFAPDVLINNAGIIHSEPLVNLMSRGDRVHSRSSWKRVIETDLDSVFFVTSRVVEQMISRRSKGIVISISSISANGNAGQSAYAAAKAGVNALTKTWAKEFGPLGFRFAAIAPGFLDTTSTRAALSESILDRLRQQIPLRRFGDVENIFQAARFIVENDYVNGAVLDIDGGLVI